MAYQQRSGSGYPTIRPTSFSARPPARPPSRGGVADATMTARPPSRGSYAGGRPVSASYSAQQGYGGYASFDRHGRPMGGGGGGGIYGHAARPRHDWSRLHPRAIECIMKHVFADADSPDPLDWTAGIGGAGQQFVKRELMVKVARVCRVWKTYAERAYHSSIAVWKASQLALSRGPVVGSIYMLGLPQIAASVKSLKLSFNLRRAHECQTLLDSFLSIARRLPNLRSLTLDFTQWSPHEMLRNEHLAALQSMTTLTHLAIIRCPSMPFLQRVLCAPAMGGLTDLDIVLSPGHHLGEGPQPQFQLGSFRLSAPASVWLQDGVAIRILLNQSWQFLEEVGITVASERGAQPVPALAASARLIELIAHQAPHLHTLAIKDDWDVHDALARQVRAGPHPANIPALPRLESLSILNVPEPIRLIRQLRPAHLMQLNVGGLYMGTANDYAGMIQRRAFPYLRQLGIRQSVGWSVDHMRQLRALSRQMGVTFESLYASPP